MRNYMEDRLLEKDERCFSQVYRQLVLQMTEDDPSVILGDADLGRAMLGDDYGELKKTHPESMFDVGLQEANLVGVCAGLSVVGRTPIAHSFASFITRRTYDTLFVSGAYAKLNLNLVGSDPGITSTYNGGTHMTFEDIGLLNSIPDVTIFEPADNTALIKLFPKLVRSSGVLYMRMARKLKPLKLYPDSAGFEAGKAMVLREGTDATVIALGTELAEAVKAAELLADRGLSVRVLDPVTVKPLDRRAVVEAARDTGAIVVAENHNVSSGLYASVCRILAEEFPCPAQAVAIHDEFGEVGNYDELLRRFHLSADDIVSAVMACVAKKPAAKR